MPIFYYSVAVALAAIFIVMRLHYRPSGKLDAIPPVGSRSWLGSWWDGLKFITNGLDIIQEGYERYKGAPFKVAGLERWTLVLTGREHMEELCRAPDDALSFNDALDELLAMQYTMGPAVRDKPYHAWLMRSKLSQNLAQLYPVMRAEFVLAFDDFLNLKGKEWKSLPALDTARKVICRTSNRLSVGPSLCRSPEWTDLIIQYALCVVRAAAIIKLFPDGLKPLAARFLTGIDGIKHRTRELLRPTIEERRRCLAVYGGEWSDKPNDFLSWLMDLKEGLDMSVEVLTGYILATNFAAIHSLSFTLTNVLYYLADHPQYIQVLREEVDSIIQEEGWSKSAVGKMCKVDSFIKEVQRLEGSNGLMRKALKDYTFDDGTFVPKGTMISVPARPTHYDDNIYPNAYTFKPFRFSDMREDPGEEEKHQYATTTVEYLPFGHGRHACPGRSLAAAELKSMLAHIVMTYDIKLETANRPKPMHISAMVIPNPTARIMFRRRVD